jgi:carbon storage regulator
MLVLSRKKGESIVILVPQPGGLFGEIEIALVEIRGDKSRIGVNADTKYPVHRREVLDAIRTAGHDPTEHLPPVAVRAK